MMSFFLAGLGELINLVREQLTFQKREAAKRDERDKKQAERDVAIITALSFSQQLQHLPHRGSPSPR